MPTRLTVIWGMSRNHVSRIPIILRRRASSHPDTIKTSATELLAATDRPACAGSNSIRRLGVGLLMCLTVCLSAPIAWGQSQVNPLTPPDRSSPRAALKTFLDASDAFATFIAQEYLPSPSRAKFDRLVEMGAIPVESLDLSALPPAERLKGSRLAALSLYEVLSRIPLPPFDQIPDADQLAAPSGGGAPYWVIPDTEIALVRVPSGPHGGEFLFSTDTVARADSFYDRVRDLPYSRPVPLANLKELIVTDGGWMIPHGWIQAMPASLRTPVADQALWKWIGFMFVFVVFTSLLWIVNRLSQLGRGRSPFLHALAQLALPASVLVATPVVVYLALVQLNLISEVGIAAGVAGTVIMYLAGSWLAWRVASAVAEAIISSPSIGSESIDAHLIRVGARLLGIFGSAALLALGASKLGIPVYGIVAGLGVGGLAIALAAQPTIENLIGGLNLFADRPIRVGEFCKYGNDAGTVETIGIRSTRIRGLDRTLTTIRTRRSPRCPS